MAGQLWGTNSLGGYFYSDELSETIRMDLAATTKFQSLCDIADFEGKGEHAGEAFHWNIVSALAVAAGTLSETAEIPVTGFTVKQGTGTINEYGLAVPYTEKLMTLGKQDAEAVIRKLLGRSVRETLDTAAHTQFNRARLRYVGTSTAAAVLTTDGTATATNSSALNLTHLHAITDLMKERNIPPFRGDDYAAVARPGALRALKNAMESINTYTETGYAKIINGEIGRIDNVRFAEQTWINKGTATNGTAWTSGLADWVYFFGEETVAEAGAVWPEIRFKIPTDYGRSKGVAWYALEGFAIMYDSTTDSGGTNSRILKWDSAA